MKGKKLIIICLSSLFMVTVNARALENTGVSDDDDYKQNITNEERNRKIESIENNIKDIDYLNNSSNIEPYIMYVDLDYGAYGYNYKQEADNWCGPACMKQTLAFHKVYNHISTALPEQEELAGKLNIKNNGLGANSEKIADVLNTYSSTFDIKESYIAVDIIGRSSPSSFLAESLSTQTKNNRTAPIILIETGNLGGISQYGSAHYRHYNTVYGVIETVNAQNNDLVSLKIKRSDPHFVDKYRGKFSNRYDEIYTDVYKADSTNSNKVLIF